MWASWLGLSEKAPLAVQAAAPSIAVFISAIGPSVSRLLLNVGRWIGLHFTLKQANRLAKSMPEGSDARKQAEANVEQIHALLNDLIWETTQIFRAKK
ncbi:hypothetical protein EAS61_29145 [Bradyrhizobium zhanjiangense]|uniref:Uncharacterized protein n=1 Tax=Bradyrhizobium zhanjiangense TaxID=1325107 RepID=A0A4Q0QEE1_9BRAD|nr:hypothetical protein EAS61_29145 [Bradyrhizobium zhanjiangense]